MSVSEYVKAQGLPSAVYVAEKANINRQMLYKWHRDNFALFEAVVSGVAEKKFREEIL